MKTLLTFVLTILSLHLFSQSIIRGTVTSTNGETIPYSTIFVKELSLGTTTNSDGNYEIKLAPGTYHVQFRSMGFIPNDIVVIADSLPGFQNVILEDQVFQFGEVKIYASKEDKAYPIMRRAISMGPYYLNQVSKYSADVYLKGTAKLEKVPGIFKKSLIVNVNDKGLKEGDIFVGENFSEIEFEAPNICKQKIISSNMSMMDNSGQTFDMGLMTKSPYDPEMNKMIIPLSPKAFSYYNFKFAGTSVDGKNMINKIKVTPKRKSQQLYSGYIYIIDGLWCLQSLDLENEQFFGTINMKIQLGELQDKVWLPISHNITIEGKMMGIKGRANYTSSVKYKSIVINEKLETPPLLSEFISEQQDDEEIELAQKTNRQQKIDEIMKKEKLSNRDALKLAQLMEKEANELKKEDKAKEPLEIPETYHLEKDDSATFRPQEYWKSLRPNPLTTEEHLSFSINDSLVKAKSEKGDTLKKNNSVKKVLGNILTGHSFKWQGDSTQLKYKGLLAFDLLSFNAAEGWKYGQKLEFSRKILNQRFFNANAWVGYSFNRKQFQWNFDTRYRYSPLHPGTISATAGNNIADYMGANGINPFVNSVSSLFFKENYGRHVQQKYFQFNNIKEIANGLELETGFAYYNRKTLENITNFSFTNKDETYHPNSITQFDGNTPALADGNSSILTVGIRFTPAQHYRIKEGLKIPEWSNWPAFSLNYKKGIKNLLGSDADWDYLEIKIDQEIKTGVSSNLTYELRGGYFLNNKLINVADYANIRTSPSPVTIEKETNKFHLLPYYSYNTNRQFIEAHINYSSPCILLKYLPWFSEQIWNENLHLSYLTLPGFRNYTEVGYFLSDVFLFADMGVFAGFENGKYTRTGFRVALKF